MELGEKIIRFVDLFNRREEVINRLHYNGTDGGGKAIDDTWDVMYDMLTELWKEWFGGDKEGFDEFESGDLEYFSEDRYLYCLASISSHQPARDVIDALWIILNKITDDKEEEGRKTAGRQLEEALQKYKVGEK